MSVPLRSITISDFRRLSGTRTFALDAPIVLVHGPNGTGKTSVLSAIEMALTGEVRSMFRQDPRYTAHLPYQGQEFATLSVEVAPELNSGGSQERMTVGGSRVEGSPALDLEARRFYSERCYLDQVSLGQLLDLYQYREGKEESALARFVNELLGLEQLDALRSGLAPAGDFRNLKNAANLLIEAELEAKQAGVDLAASTAVLETANSSLLAARQQLVQMANLLGLSVDPDDHIAVASAVRLRVDAADAETQLAEAQSIQRALTVAGGRLSALSSLPSVQQLDQQKTDLESTRAAQVQWQALYGSLLQDWAADASALDVAGAGGPSRAVLQEQISAVEVELAEHTSNVAREEELLPQIASRQGTLASLEAEVSNAQEQAGSLAEGLAALQDHLADNVCPVCDRSFSEVSSTHLSVHVAAKINDLTTQGERLRDLRNQRSAVSALVEREQNLISQIRARLLTPDQLGSARQRLDSLRALRDRLDALAPAIEEGQDLRSRIRAAEARVAELEAMASEAQSAGAELRRLGLALDSPALETEGSLHEIWARLAGLADEGVQAASERHDLLAGASDLLSKVATFEGAASKATESVAHAAGRKSMWDAKLAEAKRRQRVARDVAQAAATARTTIVQRVFTESLNNMWQSVFSRLAPRESFVPAFGIPTSSKDGLALTLQTIHSSGSLGGSPQMMLSAGNLNTAALSLFIALHLGVEPLVPCLVFDDPVQSMDEVHISQFAGLMRILSKRHERQIVVAVHERELFEYLALELSPAFEGDELITIELGIRSGESDTAFRRHVWTQDTAIAL